MFQAIQSWDLSVLWWMKSFHQPAVDWLAWFVATIAWKGWLWWLVIAGTWVRGRRDFSAHLAFALVIATIAGLPLKGLLARPRPDLYASQQLNIPMPELLTTSHSFPSGHTLLAATFAFVVASYWRGSRTWLAFAFVVLVGLARIYQGLHWPTDVLGSIALAAAAAWTAGVIVRLPAVRGFTLRPPVQSPAPVERQPVSPAGR